MTRYLPIFLTLFCMLLLPVTSRGDDTEQAMTEVSITTFGGKPDTHTNLRMIMARALNYCKTHPGTRLTFPKGRYDFAPASEGDYVIKMNGITNCVIDGQGSEFIFHGLCALVRLEEDERIRCGAIGVIHA